MDRAEADFYLGLNHEDKIREAAETLAGVIRPTPLVESDFYSGEYGCSVYIKPEHLQRTGSFKLRGAYNKVARLPELLIKKGVVAASAGNHAQGVAFAASAKGIPATIVMPNVTPLIKVDATRAYGVDVILHGNDYDECYHKAVALADENDATFIHPFDDYEIICGQGTVGLEILEELPEADEILVPIGGGGLAGGVALIAKTLKPGVKVIGVVPEGAQSMKLSLEDGRVNRLASVKTVADGVAVRGPGQLTFLIAQKYLDEVITVSEKDIMENVLLLMEKHKFVVETAGVLPLAALKHCAKPGKKTVCVTSGGNIDMVTISSIINQGMISRGRIMCFAVELPDRPGQLVQVATLLADLGANVIGLEHNQFKALDRYSDKVVLEVTVETNGHAHIHRVLETLKDVGFVIRRIY
ncbi:MAG: threonine ammonia-lyase [Clostridiales Family XIII bacterium]|jgi:threonine dehydratase|nr:threonine ammonia-lyase [Clostridiales Family XIII bacterium]